MILETAILVGTLGYTGYSMLSEDKNNRKLKKRISEVWKLVMDGVGAKAENKLNIDYQILEVFKKHYGFDAIIELPYGKSLKNFRELIPTLESAYNSDIIVDYSTKKNCLYMRCKLLSISKISAKDDLRFKWGKAFSDFNQAGETFTVGKIKDIINPNLKEKPYEEQIVGYKVIIDIPHGLNYEKLLEYEPSLNVVFPKVFIDWNTKRNRAEVDIITKPLDNKEKWTPIPCKPWELYTAMTYAYKPVVMDFKVSQGLIDGGQNGTGKTVAIISAFINLITQHTRNDFRMCISSIADKQDLRVLANANQCDYYARDLQNSLMLMRYLNNENARRSKIFEQCKQYTVNIFEYNTRNSKTKIPFLYFITDEIADYMEEPHDSDLVKKQKKEFQSLFWKLSRQGRSQGIWIVAGTQRGDNENLKANTKSNLSNKMCFYQANVSSAYTIFGNGDNLASRVTKLVKANRECLIEYSEGITIAKTLYMTNEMMAQFVKPYSNDNKYVNLNIKGEIEENEQKGDENNENNSKNGQKYNKNGEKQQESGKNISNNCKNNKKECNTNIDKIKAGLKNKKNNKL